MATQYLLNRVSNEMIDDTRYGSTHYIQSDLSDGFGRFKADGLPGCCIDQCQMLTVVMS